MKQKCFLVSARMFRYLNVSQLFWAFWAVAGCSESSNVFRGLAGNRSMTHGYFFGDASAVQAESKRLGFDLVLLGSEDDYSMVTIAGSMPSSIDGFAELVGGHVEGDTVVVAPWESAAIWLEFAEARVATSYGTPWVVDVGGLLGSGVVQSGEEFVWDRSVEERLAAGVVVASETVQGGFELVRSGTVISGVAVQAGKVVLIRCELERSTSSLGGLRVERRRVPVDVALRLGEWALVHAWSEVGVGSPFFLRGDVSGLAVRASVVGFGFPSRFR